jgi:hypothetical protein
MYINVHRAGYGHWGFLITDARGVCGRKCIIIIIIIPKRERESSSKVPFERDFHSNPIIHRWHTHGELSHESRQQLEPGSFVCPRNLIKIIRLLPPKKSQAAATATTTECECFVPHMAWKSFSFSPLRFLYSDTTRHEGIRKRVLFVTMPLCVLLPYYYYFERDSCYWLLGIFRNELDPGGSLWTAMTAIAIHIVHRHQHHRISHLQVVQNQVQLPHGSLTDATKWPCNFPPPDSPEYPKIDSSSQPNFWQLNTNKQLIIIRRPLPSLPKTSNGTRINLRSLAEVLNNREIEKGSSFARSFFSFRVHWIVDKWQAADGRERRKKIENNFVLLLKSPHMRRSNLICQSQKHLNFKQAHTKNNKKDFSLTKKVVRSWNLEIIFSGLQKEAGGMRREIEILDRLL